MGKSLCFLFGGSRPFLSPLTDPTQRSDPRVAGVAFGKKCFVFCKGGGSLAFCQVFYLRVPGPATAVDSDECFSFSALSVLLGTVTSIDCVPAVPKAQCGFVGRQTNKSVTVSPPKELNVYFWRQFMTRKTPEGKKKKTVLTA